MVHTSILHNEHVLRMSTLANLIAYQTLKICAAPVQGRRLSPSSATCPWCLQRLEHHAGKIVIPSPCDHVTMYHLQCLNLSSHPLYKYRLDRIRGLVVQWAHTYDCSQSARMQFTMIQCSCLCPFLNISKLFELISTYRVPSVTPFSFPSDSCLGRLRRFAQHITLQWNVAKFRSILSSKKGQPWCEINCKRLSC